MVGRLLCFGVSAQYFWASLCAFKGCPRTMLIEWAMATFGTVVPGIGTLHVPYASWGLAATLQKLAAVSSPGLLAGTAVVTAALAWRR